MTANSAPVLARTNPGWPYFANPGCLQASISTIARGAGRIHRGSARSGPFDRHASAPCRAPLAGRSVPLCRAYLQICHPMALPAFLSHPPRFHRTIGVDFKTFAGTANAEGEEKFSSRNETLLFSKGSLGLPLFCE